MKGWNLSLGGKGLFLVALALMALFFCIFIVLVLGNSKGTQGNVSNFWELLNWTQGWAPISYKWIYNPPCKWPKIHGFAWGCNLTYNRPYNAVYNNRLETPTLQHNLSIPRRFGGCECSSRSGGCDRCEFAGGQWTLAAVTRTLQQWKGEWTCMTSRGIFGSSKLARLWGVMILKKNPQLQIGEINSRGGRWFPPHKKKQLEPATVHQESWESLTFPRQVGETDVKNSDIKGPEVKKRKAGGHCWARGVRLVTTVLFSQVEHVTPSGKRKVRVASLLLKYSGAAWLGEFGRSKLCKKNQENMNRHSESSRAPFDQ